MSESKHDKPIILVVALTVLTAISTGVTLYGVRSVLDAPKQAEQSANQQSESRHNNQQRDVDANSADIALLSGRLLALEGKYGLDQVEIQRLDGRIDELSAREAERDKARQSDIKDLKARQLGVAHTCQTRSVITN